ncbi:MAG TPA: nodulation protein NfeD [Terriglobia bacterium]|nr:nodulation protein NfeD [Terriglobia bacterium]
MRTKLFKYGLTQSVLLMGVFALTPLYAAQSPPVVVQIDLDGVVQAVSADYVVRGITYANQTGASAILLELSTPGGLGDSMREIIRAVMNSRVPVITYVYPSGSRAASAGFFILLAGDIAVMAPGTNTGAAHPVMIGGLGVGKTEETKVLNDSAAFIRSIADTRGRNEKMAEDGVRQSISLTDQEALKNNLINAIANSPEDIFKEFDGKTIKRSDGSETVLKLAGARIVPYQMPWFKRILSWVANPNIAFILGAIGVLGLYIEFTHPGGILPGVAGAIALVLSLFGFHLMPINYAGVALILIGLALFGLEAAYTSHGILAAGGIAAMIFGSMILINSPWPGTRIYITTVLSVVVPLAVITVVLMRFAWKATRSKAVTGEEGLVNSIGVARTDLNPEGKVLVHGELWDARAEQHIPPGGRVRVRKVEGFTLHVEPVEESR